MYSIFINLFVFKIRHLSCELRTVASSAALDSFMAYNKSLISMKTFESRNQFLKKLFLVWK